MRVVASIILTLAITGGTAAAQTSTASSEQNDWSLDASAYTYIVPDSENYVQPTVAANRDWLHVEARFNYEDRDTGSVWFGYNFSVGEEVTLEITPMVGAVIGNTDGIAPATRPPCAGGCSTSTARPSKSSTRAIRPTDFLHLVGVRPGADRLVPLRPGRAAHEGLSNGVRYPARLLRGLLLPARECGCLRLQP